jgi:hypothetical protein
MSRKNGENYSIIGPPPPDSKNSTGTPNNLFNATNINV